MTQDLDSNYVFQLIVAPRTNAMLWPVGIDTATVIGLSEAISKEYSGFGDIPFAFTFTWGDPKCTYKLQTDEDLRDLLRHLVLIHQMKFMVRVMTPSKPFSDWSLKEVWQIYEMQDKPMLQYIPPLECHHTPFADEENILRE